MKKRLIAAAAFSLLLGSAGAQAGVNLLQNGGFEDPAIATWYQNYGAHTNDPWSGPSFPGWSVVGNNVDIVSASFSPGGAPAYQGTQFLDLVGYGSTGDILQTFNTQAGKTYALSFAYGNNPWSTSTAAAAFDVLGNSGLLAGTITHSGSTTGNINWVVYTGTFVADSSSTTLRFDNTIGGGSGGVLLDAVSVSAVPELSTWAMMLIGFAGMGFVAYWRARKSAAPA
ncbi:MAG TPA: DUF642 domain-containing protein [Xanthobacteraceae bacterium]|nr:DUF642 domain-containing protein [Xanthobacteraceae bacterium]